MAAPSFIPTFMSSLAPAIGASAIVLERVLRSQSSILLRFESSSRCTLISHHHPLSFFFFFSRSLFLSRQSSLQIENSEFQLGKF